jgi:outer membrane biosynthesis protein TonB
MGKWVRGLLTVVALLVPATVRAAASPGSKQAIYDTAQAAFDKRDWNGTITGFSAVLPPNDKALSGTSQAIISSRFALALLRVGRVDEARVAADRALAALPASDSTNRIDALSTAAAAARFGFDYRAATDYYRQALALAEAAGDKATVVDTDIGLAYALMTIDPAAVATTLDGLLGDASLKTVIKPDVIAVLQDLRARAALNAGDLGTAKTWAERAVTRSGGLTTRVSGAQIAMRNDAGIIASLRKDDDDAHQYLAYTGAGHLKDMGWITHYKGDLPVCDDFADIKPADTVIIQFAIADDGHVDGALPIYASRTGHLGEAFARAVSKWRWNPEELTKADAFWRSTLVLQLRCQTRPSPEGLGRPINDAIVEWLKSKGIDSSSDQLEGYVAPNDTRLALDGVVALPALFARCCGGHDAEAQLTRIQQILDANQAPPAAYAMLTSMRASASTAHEETVHSQQQARATAFARVVPAFEARYSGDMSTAWLQLEWALALEGAGDFQHAGPLLKAVLAMPVAVLPEDAPIRRVALLHNAITARNPSDAEEAQAQLTQAGLSADSCSLFDTRPIPTSVAIASSQFPAEAIRWGFEGYVDEAYDIGADGRVSNIRTVFAYPPFVFAKSTEDAVRSFRYLPPKIGDKVAGCAGETQSVHYAIPQR